MAVRRAPCGSRRAREGDREHAVEVTVEDAAGVACDAEHFALPARRPELETPERLTEPVALTGREQFDPKQVAGALECLALARGRVDVRDLGTVNEHQATHAIPQTTRSGSSWGRARMVASCSS